MPSRPTHIPTETSRFATWLRLPMAILVVTAHLDAPGLSSVNNLNELAYVSLLGIFDLVSHGAVGVFFILSGYLYFATADRFDGRTYLRKLRTRACTLGVPYLLWNAIIFALTAAGVYRALHSGGTLHEGLEDTLTVRRFLESFWCWGSNDTDWSIFGLLQMKLISVYPIDLPLWFVRCLLVLSVFAPVVYAGLRYLGRWMVATTAFFFLANLWISDLVPEVSGCFFFTLGAWLGLRRASLTDLCAGRRMLVAAMTVVTMVVEVYGAIVGDDRLVQALHPFAQLVVALLLLIVGAKLFKRGRLRWATPLAGASFMVFAAHYPYLTAYSRIFVTWAMGKIGIAVSAGSVPMALICWVLSVVVAICLWWAVRQTVPGVAKALSGGRG